MPKDFIPGRMADRLAWSTVFSNGITASAVALGLTVPMAANYATLHGIFETAQGIAVDPATRNSGTILARDVAWDNCEANARELARIIQAHPGVTPTQLNNLGLSVRDTSPSPVGPPTTKPIVNIEIIRNLQHVIRIRDEATPTSSAKPPGCIGWEVWVKVCNPGDPEPLSVAECMYIGLATRVPFEVPYTPADANKIAYIIARAVNGKGETGPQSDQISGTIAA